MRITILLILTLFISIKSNAQQTPILIKYRSMAIDYNHDLKSAEKNISASLELEKAARADTKPKLAAGGDFQYTGNAMSLSLDLPSLNGPVNFEGRNMRYGVSASLLQPIYTGGKVLESIKIAQHNSSFALNQKDAIRSEVCFQTDIQYWNTVARAEMVDITANYYSSIKSLVKIIEERVAVGLVDPQDLLMVEVKLNEAEYQLLQSKSNLEIGRMALNSLVGISLSEKSEIDSLITPIVNVDAVVGVDSNVNPVVEMAKNKIEIAESSLKLNDSKYKPQLYAGLDGSYSSPGHDFKADLDPNYAVYAKLVVPLFEWGKRKSEKQAYSNRIGIAEDNLNKIEDAVELDIQTSKVSLCEAAERVRLTENSLEKANQNEQKAMERYAEGKASIVEVIDAQIYKQTAQINYTHTKLAAQNSYSEFIKALNRY